MQFDISEAIQHWGVFRKSAIAIRSARESVSYETLDRRATRVASVLTRAVDAHTRVALMISDKPQFLTALIGILRAGNSVVLLNQLLGPEALQKCITDAKVRNVVVDDYFNNLLNASSRRMLKLKKLLYHGNRLRGNHLRQTRLSNIFPVARPEDEWGVFYSSGTTGIPKGIVRDHYSVVTELLGWCLDLGLNFQSSFFIGRPLYYTGGLVLSLSTLLAGGCIGVDEKSDWPAYDSYVKKHRVDFAFFVPDQLREFVRSAKQSGSAVRGAKQVLVMGGNISAGEKRDAARTLHSMVIESWGNSEGLGTITSPGDLRRRPKSIGRPFLTDRMFIVDSKGKQLPTGRIGRIAGGVEAAFSRYCNKPKATNAAKKKDLIVSDDYGYVDSAGYFYIVGRSDDLITSGDRPTFTSAVETVLRRHRSVRECAVVNVGKRAGPARLVGFVVLEPSRRSPSEILRATNARLSSRLRLQSITTVQSLPRNAAGKVDKAALLESAL